MDDSIADSEVIDILYGEGTREKLAKAPEDQGWSQTAMLALTERRPLSCVLDELCSYGRAVVVVVVDENVYSYYNENGVRLVEPSEYIDSEEEDYSDGAGADTTPPGHS